MPEYTYTDGSNEIIVIHPIDFDCTIITGAGVQMWRMPSKNVGVNWGGLSPSAAEWQSPELQAHIKNADSMRDEYERNKKDD